MCAIEGDREGGERETVRVCKRGREREGECVYAQREIEREGGERACVCAKEGDREGGSEREREGECVYAQREIEREREIECVCVCKRERERERGSRNERESDGK